MRTGKELYQVFEDNQRWFYTGLCGWSWMLSYKYILSQEEYYFLIEELEKYRQSNKINTTHY